jgi:hypothetical protein
MRLTGVVFILLCIQYRLENHIQRYSEHQLQIRNRTKVGNKQLQWRRRNQRSGTTRFH